MKIRLTQEDVLKVRKWTLERLAEREIRCDRLDGAVVEMVLKEYIKYLDWQLVEAKKIGECPCLMPTADHCCDATYHWGCIVFCACEAQIHPEWARRQTYKQVECSNEFHL